MFGQIGLDRVECLVVLLRGWGRLDLRDQVRQIILTAFGEMYLLADPLPSARSRQNCRQTAFSHVAFRAESRDSSGWNGAGTKCTTLVIISRG